MFVGLCPWRWALKKKGGDTQLVGSTSKAWESVGEERPSSYFGTTHKIIINPRGCQVLTWSDKKNVYRFLFIMDVLGYYFIAIRPNLWGTPHTISLGFTALHFPVSAKSCVDPLDGQPGASKPLSVQATAAILSELHHLSNCETNAQLLLDSLSNCSFHLLTFYIR